MDILRLISIALLGTIVAVFFRDVKGEVSLFIVITTGIIMLLMMLGGLAEAVSAFQTIASGSGIEPRFISIVLKVVGIGYLTEFASAIAEDFGIKSLSQKLQLGGKITILVLSLPIITGLIRLFTQLVTV